MNYECENREVTITNLSNCSHKLKNIQINPDDKLIGEGAYGKVYQGKAKLLNNKEINIAIKIIVCTLQEQTFIDAEVEYSYLMGNSGIGPIVYDAFYIKGKKNIIQIIIMEKFDCDVYIALEDANILKSTKENMIYKMIQLLDKQIYEVGLECYDIKSNNFVYRKADKEVRMIDFGAYWCDYINSKNIDMVYLALLMQLAYVLIMYNINNIYYNITNKDILNIFNEIPIFKERRTNILKLQIEIKNNILLYNKIDSYIFNNFDLFNKLKSKDINSNLWKLFNIFDEILSA